MFKKILIINIIIVGKDQHISVWCQKSDLLLKTPDLPQKSLFPSYHTTQLLNLRQAQLVPSIMHTIKNSSVKNTGLF